MDDQVGRVERKIALAATNDNKRMTFAELRAFVQAAMQADVPDDAQVKATATMSGHLKRIEVG
jgi:hypothetical protein